MQPITLDHPDDFVNPESWKELSIGTIYNVRQGEGEDEDKLVADLMINDAEAMQAIEDGILRQVSCGYLAKFEETGPGRGIQTGFEGNHVAILKYGRCGAECAIKDAANDPALDMQHKKYAVIDRLPDELGKNMKQIKDLFKKTTDASPAKEDAKANDEMDLNEFMEKFSALAEMVATHGERLSTVESNMMTADADPEADEDKKEDKVDDEDSDMKEDKAKDADPFAKMNTLLEKILGAVAQTNDAEPAEPKAEEAYVSDALTKSRAEILSPGIHDSKDIKEQSLKKAYETEDGKEVIDTILSGQTFDSADKEMLFNSSSELLKVIRKGGEHSYTPSNDSKEQKKGFITDKEFNAKCKEAWSQVK
jgi:hypothetical protein